LSIFFLSHFTIFPQSCKIQFAKSANSYETSTLTEPQTRPTSYKCFKSATAYSTAKGGIIQQTISTRRHRILQTENAFVIRCPEHRSGELAQVHTAISFPSAAPAATTARAHLSLLQTAPPDLMGQCTARECNSIHKLGI